MALRPFFNLNYLLLIGGKIFMNQVEIDFNNRKQLLNESWLAMFGSWSKAILEQMFGKDFVNKMNLKEEENEEDTKFKLKITGKRKDVDAYINALSKEKDYIESLLKNGEKDKNTSKAKEKLDKSVKHFEKLTGIKWPFK